MTPSPRDTRRLNERFAPGEHVQIQFSGDPHNRWWMGQVVAVHAPGVWVQLQNGQCFFVTNTRRIRPVASPPA